MSLLKKAKTWYFPDFLNKAEADKLLEQCLKLDFSRKEREGRDTILYGDAEKYKYALNEAIPTPWVDFLAVLKIRLEEKCVELGYDKTEFTVMLGNKYLNGKEKFKPHADREELDNPFPIAVLSIGAERWFEWMAYDIDETDDITCENTTREKVRIKLEHGSLTIMDSETHRHYIHALPIDESIHNIRISLTFRVSPFTRPDYTLGGTRTVLANADREFFNDATDVWIDRRSEFNNVYKIGEDGTRSEVVEKHKLYFYDKIKSDPNFVENLEKLRGKRLMCHCLPNECHGNVILEYLK